jgi:hypothetical protein
LYRNATLRPDLLSYAEKPTMKRSTLILAALACFAACKQTIRDSGCITRYTGSVYMRVSITDKQRDTINSLFAANGLSMAGYDLSTYYSTTIKDSLGNPVYDQIVSASITINGLPVFYSGISWFFFNGVWQKANTTTFQYPYPGSDTTGHQTLPALRSAFFRTFDSALYTKNNLGSVKMGRPGIYYHDSCFFAQLGYIDASYQPNSGLVGGQKLVKVWKVFPENPAPVVNVYRAAGPDVYVIDSTGAAWPQYLFYPGGPILFD